MAPRPLTKRQVAFVNAYIGEAEGNATEACRLAGYQGDARSLAVIGFDNLRKANIAEAIQSQLQGLDQRGIAVKQRRIDAKIERWQALMAVRRARADAFRQQAEEHPGDPLPPGWESGFHVRQIKAVPAGRGETTLIEEFVLDTAMMRELDTLEKDIAQECGQLQTNVSVRHSGRVQHDLRYSGYDELDKLSLDEIEMLEGIRAKIDAGLVES